MEVIIAGKKFSLDVKWIKITLNILWWILLASCSSYITYKTTLSHLETKVEETKGQVGGLTGQVGGISSTLQERIKVTDGRFEKLETGQSQLNEKVTVIQGDVKGMSKQVDNLVLLVSALLRDKVAEKPVNSQPATYEVR